MVKIKVEDSHRIEGNWIFVPIDDLITPKAGRICYGPSYWVINSKREVVFWKDYNSPQCNLTKAILGGRLIKSRDCIEKGPHSWPDLEEIIFIKMAFIPHDCSDFI
jgi:hypothetical protein